MFPLRRVTELQNVLPCAIVLDIEHDLVSRFEVHVLL